MADTERSRRGMSVPAGDLGPVRWRKSTASNPAATAWSWPTSRAERSPCGLARPARPGTDLHPGRDQAFVAGAKSGEFDDLTV